MAHFQHTLSREAAQADQDVFWTARAHVLVPDALLLSEVALHLKLHAATVWESGSCTARQLVRALHPVKIW